METTVQNETFEALLTDLGLNPALLTDQAPLLAETNSKYLRDLRTNLNNALKYPNLTEKEAVLLALSAAINDKNQAMTEAFTTKARALGTTEAELAEVAAVTSIMMVNNVVYRFRHFVNKDYYSQTPLGIRQNIMMNPVLGKEFFELISVAISALNGCEICVTSHEESLRKMGTTEARIFDAVRLVGIVRGARIL